MNALRAALTVPSRRLFSTTPSRSSDLAKLILVGRLGSEPQVKVTRTDKEYVSYAVATTNYPPPPPSEDGTRPAPATTWHRVLCFNPSQVAYLKTLQKGSQVYVEANFETREPVADAEPGSFESQRQIFLRHESIRVLSRPKVAETE